MPDDKTKRKGTGESKPGLKVASQSAQDIPTTKTFHKDSSGKMVPYEGMMYEDIKKKYPKAMKSNPHAAAMDEIKKTNKAKEIGKAWDNKQSPSKFD